MENYLGLIIAVENYHDSENLPQVMFAQNDAKAFINSLVKLGCKRENLTYLYDDSATKTAIDDEIKALSRDATQSNTIIFYFAGHGILESGKNRISCVDTDAQYLATTTIEIEAILASFEKCKSNKVIAFLDCCHSGIHFSNTERSIGKQMSIDDLKYAYKDSEHLTVFASCKSTEKSQADTKREHGVWTYFLIQALNGNAKGIYESNILFSDKLQQYLLDNTSQRVQEITKNSRNQTPVKFGKETNHKFIVADLSQYLTKEENENITFAKDITLLSIEKDLVKNLLGFKSGYRPPQKIDDYHDNWIKKISTEHIRKKLEEIEDELQKELKYKRNSMEISIIDNGIGMLSTIDFDYEITICQSKDRADGYTLTRSICNLKNDSIFKEVEFNKLFILKFEKLERRFEKKINVRKLIDKIANAVNEESVDIKYSTGDTTTCNIRVNTFRGEIAITDQSISIEMKMRNSPQTLVNQWKDAYRLLSR